MKRLVLVAVITGAVAVSGCGADPAPKGTGDAKVLTPSSSAPTAEAAAPAFNASGWLAGNIKPQLPVGSDGEVALLDQALSKDGMGSATLAVAFRNNTSDAISHVDLTAVARVKGDLVATGQSQGSIPAQVQPGELGFAYIYFEDAKSLPDKGVSYTLSAETMPADQSSYNTAPLTVKEATYNGSSFVGTAVNETQKPLTGPYSVEIFCFTKQGKLLNHVDGFANQDGDLAAGATASFSVDLYDTKCDNFVIGVNGWFA